VSKTTGEARTAWRPGTVLWTVMPWPEWYDMVKGQVDFTQFGECKLVQVRVCRRLRSNYSGATESWVAHYEVQFEREEDGRAFYDRFEQEWDRPFPQEEGHLFERSEDAQQAAVAKLTAARDALNGGIERILNLEAS